MCTIFPTRFYYCAKCLHRTMGMNGSEKCNIGPSCWRNCFSGVKFSARVPLVLTWWNVKIYCIYLFIVIVIQNCIPFSCFQARAIVCNSTIAIHILWCASLLDDSCLCGHGFTVAVGRTKASLPVLDKYGWKPQKNKNGKMHFVLFRFARMKWQFGWNNSAYVWQIYRGLVSKIYTRLSFCKQIRRMFASVTVPVNEIAHKNIECR